MTIRPYKPADHDAVIILWRISREKSLPDFQREKGHFFYEDLDYFRDHILMKDTIWVLEAKGRPAAYLAMFGDFIDHLYVHPAHWRKGLGRRLLDFARERSPLHLWLYTLQINTAARAFYEKHGFTAEKFGISEPPENEPDVEYHWRARKD